MAANDQSERNRLRARVEIIPQEEIGSIASVSPPNGYFDYPEGPTEPDGTLPVVSWVATGHTRMVFPRPMSIQEEQVWIQNVGNGSGHLSNINYSGSVLPKWTTLDIFTVDETGAAADLGYYVNIERVREPTANG